MDGVLIIELIALALIGLAQIFPPLLADETA
jgi:hypothetical protein